MTKTISAKELGKLHDANVQIELIDVRTPAEFQEVHVAFAKNVPLDRLDPNAYQSARNGTEAEPLYILCRSGGRGKQACDKFLAAGIANTINVDGGTLACEAAGLPVLRGQKIMALERQVRIAAGSLVALGSALALVHLYFLALPIFIGCGLVFSGITDTCGMGMLIARMPWNQTGVTGSSTVSCKR